MVAVSLKKEIKKETERFTPDIVGITAMTPTIQSGVQTAKVIRSVTSAMIVMGGPHPSIMPEETASLDEVDVVVRGEGEQTMSELVKAIEMGGGFKKVKGITFSSNKKIINNPPMPLINDLDTIPFPARDLLPMGRYKQHIGHPKSFATMITSRGCPNNCIYCTKAIFGRKYRFRSANNVIEEINQVITKYKVKDIVFYDDAFTAHKGRVETLCENLMDAGIDIRWKCESRVDTVELELLEKMRNAGCHVIAYGVESGNNRLLRTLKKRITTKQIEETFKITKDVGIETLAYIMIGIPGETKATIKKTLDFTIKLDPDYVQFSIATPYPKTELYEIALKDGHLKSDKWAKFAYAGDSATPVMRTESLDHEELNLELKRMIKKFYLRPRYIVKQIKKSTTPAIIKRNISGLKSILKWTKDVR